MFVYSYDALAGGDYLVSRTENALADAHGDFHIAGQAFDVCIDNYSGFCYWFEMRMEDASLLFCVEEAYNPDCLKGFGVCKRNNFGMVFDFFLDKKRVRVVRFEICDQLLRAKERAIHVGEAVNGFCENSNAFSVGTADGFQYELRGQFLRQEFFFLLIVSKRSIVYAINPGGFVVAEKIKFWYSEG